MAKIGIVSLAGAAGVAVAAGCSEDLFKSLEPHVRPGWAGVIGGAVLLIALLLAYSLLVKVLGSWRKNDACARANTLTLTHPAGDSSASQWRDVA